MLPGANRTLGISQSTPSQALPSTSDFPASYTQPASPYPDALESRDQTGWPTLTSGGFRNSYASIDQFPSDVGHGYNHQAPPIFYQPSPQIPTFQISPVEGQSHAAALARDRDQNRHRPFLLPAFGSNQKMGGIETYPISPPSERERRASITTPISGPESVITDPIETSTPDGTRGPQISVKRGEPPRNDNGKIYCAHLECAKDIPIFRRPCEWK